MAVILGQKPAAPARTGKRRASRHAAPFWIRAFAVVAAAAAASVALAFASVAGQVQDDITELGARIVPQVAATENLSLALSDMDAQLANVLLAGDDPGLAGQRTASLDTYEKDRQRATTALQQVTAVAGTDADAQKRVHDVLEQFGEYQKLAGQAMVLGDHEGNDAGQPSQDVLFLQRQATDVLHTTQNGVRDLANSNVDLFDQSYQDRANTAADARLVLLALGCLLVATLIGLQVVLRLRMHRRVNPAIAVATVLAGWLVIGGLLLLGNESGRLGNAKEGAFASLRLAWQARSVSYDAHADESRYLLDPDHAQRYEHDFFEKSQSLAGVYAPTLAEYDDNLGVVVTVYTTDGRVEMDGLIAGMLRTADSADERKAAKLMLVTYLTYQRSDAAIRDYMASGQLRPAIQLNAGAASQQFDDYIEALNRLVNTNQAGFDASITGGENALDGWTGTIPYGAGALIVALVVVGVWPRLNEYR